MDITVERAKECDAETIAHNVVAMAEEGSGITLDPDTVRHGVNGLFQQPGLGFYIVARVQEEVVGSLVIVYEWSDWRNGVYWWIHSVYVGPSLRRKGVYTKMYEFVREEAEKHPECCGIRLSVNRRNVVARSVYEKLGMKESESIIYGA